MSRSFKYALVLIAIIALPSLEGLNAQSAPDEQKDKAEQTYDAIKDRFGTADALENNLTSPLLSGTGFTTFDGTRSFNQRISCPSSAHYLELFFGIGSGGDLSPVSIKQDTDFNGAYDVAYVLPVAASGICANGVISCRSGSFDECKSYRWKAGTSGRVSIEKVELSSLAGCYCVNNSCGTNLGFVNRSTILADLAGGIAGALMARDPRYAVSSVEKTDFVIKLAGQDTSACSPRPDTPQHTYFDDPTKLSDDAFAASTGDSVFGLVQSIPTGDDLSLVSKSCKLERQVTLNEILGTDIITRVTSSPEYAESACAGDPDCFHFALGPGEDNILRRSGDCFYVTKELVWNIDHIDSLTEAVLLDADYEDQIAIKVNDGLIFSTGGFDGINRPDDCQIDDQRSISINRSFKSALQIGRNTLSLVIAVKKKGSGVVRGRIRYQPSCDLVESISDTCSSFASDDRCRLVGETVDGVRTFNNGGRTGLTPISQSRTLYGARCTKSFSKPWFIRDRTYECEYDSDGARSFDFVRATHIYSASTFDQFADRQIGSDGSIQTITGNYSIDTEFGISNCEQICKTRVGAPDTEVSSTGVVGDLLTNPQTGVFQYHQCAAGVCPAGPGETIVSACGCLGEFPQALTLMQSFRLASQDLICTSGTQQPVQ